MADVAVDVLVDCLELVLNKYNMHLGNPKEVEELLEDFLLVRSFLKEFNPDISDDDSRILTELKDLASEAWEELYPFVAKAIVKDEECCIPDHPALKLGCFTDAIRSIKIRMMQMEKRSEVLKTDHSNFSGDLSEETRFRGDEREILVGFKDEVLKLKDGLGGDRKKLEVTTVVGMAGVGKTTLVKHVYDDDWITRRFHIRAWACVSQEYKKRDLLLSILSSVDFVESDKKIHCREKDDELELQVYRKLKRRRYLVVLDDLWSLDAWGDLKNLLPDDSNGSRIVVTTRLSEVASGLKPPSALHRLRFLTENESWDLLEYRVFSKRECPSELAEVGRTIAVKCKGLPLAICVVAGFLAKKVEIEFWMEVCARLNSYVGNSQQLMDILALSYEHLPPHLRRCFLYFGAFPEDSAVLVYRLIWLWIAEGFVGPEEEKVLEKVAEEYVMDLVGRNLIVVSKRNSGGKIRVCRVHDMLRQLCLREAEEKNSVSPIDWYNLVASSSASVVSTMNRCFRSHGFHDSTERPPLAEYIPSPFCYVNEGTKQIRTSFMYKFLRVLNLCYILLHIFPLEILQLFHLRFLELWIQKLDRLPPSISILGNLEFLLITKEDIGGVTVPFSVWKMIRLRHLRISEELHFEKPWPYDMDYPNILNELQTLSALTLSRSIKNALDVLEKTPNLRKIIFYRGPNKSGRFCLPNLSNLKHLESLKLSENSWQPTHTTIPDPHFFPLSLKKVILSGGHMDWPEISKLGKLPSLEILKLKRNCFHGAEWRTNEGDFIRLKFLKLSWMDLEKWNSCADHFPSLEHLVLERCKYLEEIPSALGDVAALQLIEVYWCSQSTSDSAKRIQQEQEGFGNDELKVITYSLHKKEESFDECHIS